MSVGGYCPEEDILKAIKIYRNVTDSEDIIREIDFIQAVCTLEGEVWSSCKGPDMRDKVEKLTNGEWVNDNEIIKLGLMFRVIELDTDDYDALRNRMKYK